MLIAVGSDNFGNELATTARVVPGEVSVEPEPGDGVQEFVYTKLQRRQREDDGEVEGDSLRDHRRRDDERDEREHRHDGGRNDDTDDEVLREPLHVLHHFKADHVAVRLGAQRERIASGRRGAVVVKERREELAHRILERQDLDAVELVSSSHGDRHASVPQAALPQCLPAAGGVAFAANYEPRRGGGRHKAADCRRAPPVRGYLDFEVLDVEREVGELHLQRATSAADRPPRAAKSAVAAPDPRPDL